MQITDKIIRRISTEISKSDHTLVHGKPGILIALSYYYRFQTDSSFKDEIDNAIESCINELCEDIENISMDGSLAFGMTGLAYSMRVAQDLGQNKKINSLWLGQLESVIQETLKIQLYHKDYDLLRGATGNMVYLLRYMPNKDIIKNYVDSLYENAIWVSEGQCYWVFYSYNEETRQLEYRDDIVNLGLAHGLTGVISILSEIYNQGICKEKCYLLISGAVKYLKNNQNTNGKSQFCGIVYSGAEKQSSSRLGWCYGDSSMGLSIIKAGIHCNNSEWVDYGNSVCIKSTERTLENSDLIEHGICHGYLGAMYIYTRLYKATKNLKYLERKEYWYNVAMKNRDFSIDELGFFQTDLDEDGSVNKYTKPGLLQGLSGIYLCLASRDKIEYPWDVIFLLNI